MNLWFVLTGYYDLPIQGHLRSPVLRWRICGILVPLQTETSESVPCLVISSELIHIKTYMFAITTLCSSALQQAPSCGFCGSADG